MRTIGLCSLLALAALAAFLAFSWIGSGDDTYKRFIESPEAPSEGKPLILEKESVVAESEFLALSINPATGEIAVADKRTGAISRSNPQGEDNIANASSQSKLKSQLLVEYYNADRLLGGYSSFEHSVQNGGLSLESIDGGVRALYEFGKEKSKTGIVPLKISAERLDAFIESLASSGHDKEAKNIKNRYKSSGDGFMELGESSRSGAGTLRALNEQFELAGYTQEDFEKDSQGSAQTFMKAAIEYRLDGESLVVSLPFSLIKESGVQVASISVLPYFGSAGMDEEGYFLLPNGAGSLMRFNNGKVEAQDYSQDIYGRDPLSASDFLELENMVPARLPILGIEKKESTLLAFVTKGAAFATLSAEVAGKTSSQNSAKFSFAVRGSGTLAMFGITGETAELPVLEPNIYDACAEIRYSFLPPEKKGYSGMASFLRGELALEKSNSAGIPIFLDIYGAIPDGKSVIAMTTFDQVQSISKELSSLGVANQRILLEGWQKGGYYQDSLGKANALSLLGGSKGLAYLASYAQSSGVKLYASQAFQLVSQSASFSEDREASRFYSGAIAKLGQTSPVSFSTQSSLGHPETVSSFLSPKLLPKKASQFLDSIKELPIGIGLRDLGDILVSDRRKSEIINRVAALQIASAQLEHLSEKPLCVSGGNLYATFAATDLAGVPLTSNTQTAVDESVPFYAMVFHGAKDFCGEPLNITGAYDRREAALFLIENGASPRFALSWEKASFMKDTGMNRLYATTASNWLEEAAELFLEVSSALSQASGSFVESHEIKGDLRITTYDNGVSIAVNRGTEPELFEGELVLPKSWLVLRASA